MNIAKKLFNPQQLPQATLTLYTVPAKTKCVLKALVASNTSNVVRSVAVYLITAGDAAGDQNTIAKTLNVPALTAIQIPGVANLVLDGGDFIQATADQAGITLFGAGLEVS